MLYVGDCFNMLNNECVCICIVVEFMGKFIVYFFLF